MNDKQNLSWVIKATPERLKYHKIKKIEGGISWFFMSIVIILFSYIVFSLVEEIYYINLKMIYFIGLLFFLSYPIYFFKFFNFFETYYLIDDMGIHIVKSSKERIYNWSQLYNFGKNEEDAVTKLNYFINNDIPALGGRIFNTPLSLGFKDKNNVIIFIGLKNESIFKNKNKSFFELEVPINLEDNIKNILSLKLHK